MSPQLVGLLKSIIEFLGTIASLTATTIDDNVVAAIRVAMDNPAVLAIIDAILQRIRSEPTTTLEGAFGACSPANISEAETALQGTGIPLVVLLRIVLPLLLRKLG